MPPPTSQAPGFGIEELTGEQRVVLLQGRALPYQGVGWNARQRTKKTVYAGNPVGTIQILGPDYDNTTIEGMWKQRFLSGQIVVSTGEEITTPEQAVRLFESLVTSGNTLAVQWGPVVRYGLMVNFEHVWLRPQDLRWTAEFEWTGASEIPARATPAPSDDSDVQDTSTQTDDALVADPASIDSEYQETVTEEANSTRVNVGQLFVALQEIRAQVSTSIASVQAALSSAEAVRTGVGSSLLTLSDLPYTEAQRVDTVVEVFACEAWRMTTAEASRRLRAACQRRAIEVAKAAIPSAIAVVVMPGDQTLRDLARIYYGSADSWQLIADANGLVGAIVEAGTIVVVPASTARTQR